MSSSPREASATARPNLRLAFCDFAAARYACLNWHYSRAIPSGALVRVGAWEDGRFIGAVIFGHGSTPRIGQPYNLSQFECIELVRVALAAHRSPVSQIVAISIRLLRKQSPDLKLIVSYADPDEGHHGGIYQAMNWIYQGMSDAHSYCRINGRIRHRRSCNSVYGTSEVAKLRQMGYEAELVRKSGKHKYLYPLTADLDKRLRPIHQPYPKRAPSIGSDAPGHQPG